MAQWALPTGDNSGTSGSECAGDGDANIFDEIDEGFGAGRGSGSGPDDATTAWTHVAQVDRSLTFKRFDTNSVTDPSSSSGHILRLRRAKGNGCTPASNGIQVDSGMAILQGSTDIATDTATAIDATWTTQSLTLSGTQADSISNYADLKLEAWYVRVGGGSPRVLINSAMEFEVPDAAPTDFPPKPTIRLDAVHHSFSW